MADAAESWFGMLVGAWRGVGLGLELGNGVRAWETERL